MIRKIHPCLPSFKSEFTASVPLTRIRDIAHRNDIPHDLKVMITFHNLGYSMKLLLSHLLLSTARNQAYYTKQASPEC